jgi:hypothetical protein
MTDALGALPLLSLLCLSIVAVVLVGWLSYERALRPLYPQSKAGTALIIVWVALLAWCTFTYPPIACLGVGIVVPLFGDAFYRAWTVRVLGLSVFNDRMTELIRKRGPSAYVRHLATRQLIHASIPTVLMILHSQSPNENVWMLSVGMFTGLAGSLIGLGRWSFRTAHHLTQELPGRTDGAA